MENHDNDQAIAHQAQCEQQEYECWLARRFDVPIPQPEITEDDLRAFFPTRFQAA